MKVKEWLNFRTIIIIFFVLWLYGVSNTVFVVNRLNVDTKYAQAAQEFLEEKYGESFYVEPNCRDPRDKLIPKFDFPQTCYLYAYPLSDEHYVFPVYITKKEDSYKIETIRDDYYWKFLRSQLQEYTTGYFSDVLGEDMKVAISMSYINDGFPRELNNESTLEDYFLSSETPNIDFKIFVPSSEGLSTEEIENKTREFASELFKTGRFTKSSHIIVCYPNETDLFDTIDTSIDQGVRARDYSFNKRGKYEKPFWEDIKKITYICSIGMSD